jgi:hypothetical protein
MSKGRGPALGARLRRWAAGGVVAIGLLPLSSAINTPTVSAANNFCANLGHGINASSGARLYCDYAASHKAGQVKAKAAVRAAQPERNSEGVARQFGSNVDSASPQEDQGPASQQSYGQSETSIAAIGSYVVHAWNDSTGFFAPCPSPMHKEELSGFGFSSDGGRSFTDMGGLPNDCRTGFLFFGDPSVETWQTGGHTYFYISGLYINFSTGQSDIAMDACSVNGSGGSATLDCHGPIIIATGGATDFLDKDYFSIDPARHQLYNTYTRFNANPSDPGFQGQIELAKCDLTDPANPNCLPGTAPAPYYIVQAPQTCENEGAYPAVDVRSGDVYVAWEYNWSTDLGPGGGAPVSCIVTPHENRVAYVPAACLTATPCTTAPNQAAIGVVSIDVAFVPGFNRVPFAFPVNAPAGDFPRIAVSDPAGTVSLVWNDARRIPSADILLQSFQLGSLSPVQDAPVRLNADGGPNWNIMPALRNADADGKLNVSWYQQHEPGALTDVMAAMRIDPRTGETPANVRVTTGPTGWLNVSSDIIPNFGDYTDNYVLATASAPYTDRVLFVSWSDGRLGLPQPFAARTGDNGQNGQ